MSRVKLDQLYSKHLQSMTSNGHTFCHTKKTAKKCDNLGTFSQKILFLDYNIIKNAKSVTI